MHLPPSPILRNHGKPRADPGPPQFHPGHRATKWPIFSLVADLRDYRPPAVASGRAASAGVTITPAAAADLAAVLAFETATFPSWTRWFRADHQDILLTRDGAGTIVATLLFDGPGADTVFGPMLGPAAATIGCVGVAPPMEGRCTGTALVARAPEILRDRGAGACHIGWTVRECFNTRAGYRPWRRYRMFRTATSCHRAPPSTGPE